jgi:hypothetical protein
VVAGLPWGLARLQKAEMRHWVQGGSRRSHDHSALAGPMTVRKGLGWSKMDSSRKSSLLTPNPSPQQNC